MARRNMARKRKTKRFSGAPAEHRTEAKGLVRLMRKEYGGARSALSRATKSVGQKKLGLCSTALDYIMSGNAAKGALYRERTWAGGKRGGRGANRVSESLKHKFRSVCLKHPRSSRAGHW